MIGDSVQETDRLQGEGGSKASRVLRTAGRYLVAGGALAWLVSTDKLSLEPILDIPFSGGVVALLACVFLSLLGQALRWGRLVAAHGIVLSPGSALLVAWIGNFYGLLLPGSVGNELARVVYLCRRYSAPRFPAVLSVTIDRLLGLYTYMLFGAVALAAWIPGNDVPPTFILLGSVMGSLALGIPVAVCLLRSSKVRSIASRFLRQQWIEALNETRASYSANAASVRQALGLTAVATTAMIAAFWYASSLLETNASFLSVAFCVPALMVANALPISPGGIGVGEAAAMFLFAAMGVEKGAQAMLLVRVATVALRLPGLFVFLSGRSTIGPQANAPLKNSV